MATFYERMSRDYGTNTRNTLKTYADFNKKHCNMTVRKNFLIDCRRKGIFPAHIQQSFKCVFALLEENSPYTNKLQRCITHFQKTILNLEIKHTYYKLKRLDEGRHQLWAEIERQLPRQESDRFLLSQREFEGRSVTNNMHRVNQKQNRILQRTMNEEHTTTPTLNEKAVHNGCGKPVPKLAEVLMSLGHNFALPYTEVADVPMYHLMADIECILATHKDKLVEDRTRSKLVNQMQNYIHRTRHTSRFKDPSANFFDEAAETTRKFVKDNPDVVILKADKGNKTVLMKREEYEEKMKALVDVPTTYEKLPRDPTQTHIDKTKEYVERLRSLKLIDGKQANQLKSRTAVCPKIYGQPKAHKPGLPLRPVVPCMTAPTYELSKFVANIIQTSFTSKYNIKSSFEFCAYINTVALPENYVLISLDVVSLFTCIPTQLIKKAIYHWWHMIDTNISLDLFDPIAMFCIECSYFQYKDNYYQQIQGTAMGNPLSPAAADLVTEMLLNDAVNELQFNIPVIRKYVDDLILAVPEDKLDEVLAVFNSQNPSIQFTMELENERRLPFLDMVLVRQADQTVKTEWYMKQIASGRFLNYHSFHPLHHKMNVAQNFIKRVNDFSTNLSPLKIKKIVHRQLGLNDYPKPLINRMLNRIGEKTTTPTQQSTNNLEPAARNVQTESESLTKQYFSITNVNNLTREIQKTLKHDYTHITLAPKHKKTVRTLFPPVKTKTPKELQSNVIYKIPCSECECSYVGLTTQTLKQRTADHKTKQNKVFKLLEEGYTHQDQAMMELQAKSALVKHCITEKHKFSFHDTKIVDRTHNTKQLPFLEMCHIRNTDNTVNKRQDTEGLNIAYAGLLHNIKVISDESRKTINQNKNRITDVTHTNSQ